MMKKTKLIRGGIMALFVLAALLLVYLVVKQTMPDIIPLLRSGDEEALEAYLSPAICRSPAFCIWHFCRWCRSGPSSFPV